MTDLHRQIMDPLLPLDPIIFLPSATVIFSQASVILLPGGAVSQHALGHTPLPNACWDTHLPWPVHAGIHTPPAQCMLEYTPPLGRHPLGRHTPLGRQPPPPGQCFFFFFKIIFGGHKARFVFHPCRCFDRKRLSRNPHGNDVTFAITLNESESDFWRGVSPRPLDLPLLSEYEQHSEFPIPSFVMARKRLHFQLGS